ncbi:pantoate--beta-alanine ligase [Rhodothermaceae bacterium RA]|nr:pantoate--beta-alanine ligase [Rhodothermaceae bacterium RA]
MNHHARMSTGSMSDPRVMQDPAAMRSLAEEARRAGRRLALVPTMGALHEGHLALVREARSRADHVTVSIFVNPTQFGPGEDYERYPRTLEADLEALRRVGGVDAVFAPTVEGLYPYGEAANATWVTVEGLTDGLCGRYRPGHFRGVTTVVARLFNVCRPHIACFGLKDAQQFFVLRRMARELLTGVEFIGVPTVREADGLALSSRNAYLSPEERAQAPVLWKALQAAEAAIQRGELRPAAIVERMLQMLATAPLARPQYVELVDTETLQPVDRLEPGREVLAALAVYFGQTRLIDNVIVRIPSPSDR